MSRRTAFKQSDVTRVLKGAQAAGMPCAICEVDPVTGKIVVRASDVDGVVSQADNVLDRELQTYRAKHGYR